MRRAGKRYKLTFDQRKVSTKHAISNAKECEPDLENCKVGSLCQLCGQQVSIILSYVAYYFKDQALIAKPLKLFIELPPSNLNDDRKA